MSRSLSGAGLRLWVLLLALAFLAPISGGDVSPPAPASHTTVVNGGFENWTTREVSYRYAGPGCNGYDTTVSDIPTDWDSPVIWSSVCNFEMDGLQRITDVHGGTYAVRLGGTMFGSPGFQTGFELVQNHLACPGDVYYVSLWVKGGNSAGTFDAYGRVRFLDASKNVLSPVLNIVIGSGGAGGNPIPGYIFVEGTSTPAPPETRWVQFVLSKSSWGYADWDDVLVSQLADGNCPPLPPLITNVSVLSDRIRVEWSPSPSTFTSHYEIYGGPTQLALDLDAPLGIVPRNQLWWEDFDTTRQEFYYVVAATNNSAAWSPTSNTGGYYRVPLAEGWNTISLPLSPFGTFAARHILVNPLVDEVRWLDAAGNWTTTSVSDTVLKVGEGYAVHTSAATEWAVGGEPAAMLSYWRDWGFGFDETTRTTLRAWIVGSDVHLAWSPVEGSALDFYRVFRSTSRRGYFEGTFLRVGGDLTATTVVDVGAAAARESYYLVVPFDNGTAGSSAYGVGVVARPFDGHEFFGLPLKTNSTGTADAWVERVPLSLGVVFLVGPDWTWVPHFREMPEGVYDIDVLFARGYQVTTAGPGSAVLVGV